MISITSSELNYLIFRYLHESGFTHSAFAFGYEAGINKSTIEGNIVPPGALVTFVQKGIQYLELEANLSNDNAEVDEDFQFLQPVDLITKDVHELQKIIKEKKENLQRDKLKEKEKDASENGQGHEHEPSKEREKEKQEKEKEQERERTDKDREREKGKEKEKVHEDLTDTKMVVDTTDTKMVEDLTGPRHEEDRINGGNLHYFVLFKNG